MSNWLKIRRLSRHQEQCWAEASHINRLYTLLHIVRDFRQGLETILIHESERKDVAR